MWGLMWFCIPFTLATTLGLSALALDLPISIAESNAGAPRSRGIARKAFASWICSLSGTTGDPQCHRSGCVVPAGSEPEKSPTALNAAHEHAPILCHGHELLIKSKSTDMWHVNGAGLVPPAAALFLLGRGGAILMVIMLFMAVTSSGSAELVAVSSLFTYDVYRTYINPNATGALPARLPVLVCCIAQAPEQGVLLHEAWLVEYVSIIMSMGALDRLITQHALDAYECLGACHRRGHLSPC